MPLPGKVKFDLTHSEMCVVNHNLSMAASLDPKANDFERKLWIVLLVELHEKVQVKSIRVKENYKLTLTAPQAIAFYLVFSNINYKDPFEFNTMSNICSTIASKCI